MTFPGSVGASGQQEAEASAPQLRKYNLVVGLVHLVQGILLVLLSNDFKLPILMSFVDGPPGTKSSAPGVVWSVPIGIAVAIFIFFAATDHLLMAAPGINDWYMRNLREGINWTRWSEYSISASLMMVLIAR